MKSRVVVVVVLVVFSALLRAQSDTLPVYALSTATHRAGLSWIKLNDPYLSSLEYSGAGLRVELSEQRYLRAGDKRFSMLNRITGLAAITVNPASTAEIETVAGDYTFGIRYHYQPFDQLVIIAGGAMVADVGIRVNSRNVNNPVNLDLAGNLNATLGARYLLTTRKRTIRFDAGTEVPLLGIMFVPYPGLSYYEMYLSKQLSEAVFFSSLHNRQGARFSLSVDFPFRHSTLHAGWRYNQLKYQGSGPVVTLAEHSLLLGISYDLFRSSGRISRFPSNYVKVL